MPRQQRGPGGKRKGAGRPPLAPDLKRSERREVKLLPEEAKAHDLAAKAEDRTWGDWIRAAAELAIARGSTR